MHGPAKISGFPNWQIINIQGYDVKKMLNMQLHLTCNRSFPGMPVIFSYEPTLFHAWLLNEWEWINGMLKINTFSE